MILICKQLWKLLQSKFGHLSSLTSIIVNHNDSDKSHWSFPSVKCVNMIVINQFKYSCFKWELYWLSASRYGVMKRILYFCGLPLENPIIPSNNGKIISKSQSDERQRKAQHSSNHSTSFVQSCQDPVNCVNSENEAVPVPTNCDLVFWMRLYNRKLPWWFRQ